MVLTCDEAMFFFYLLIMAMLFMGIFTYFWWPKKQGKEHRRLKGLSAVHGSKDWHKKALKTNEKEKGNFFKLKSLILAAWVILFAILYSFTMHPTSKVQYNPYEVLEIVRNSNMTVIKSKYRELSKVFHPDKGGDEESFIKIKQAYETLTNPESYKNWQMYGHPDGKQVTEFGIAFPKALLYSSNWVFISLLYLVGLFSFRRVVEKKFQDKDQDDSSNQIEMVTDRIYAEEILTRENLNELSGVINIFSFSVDFHDKFNPEVRELTNEVYLSLEGLAECLTNNCGIKVCDNNAPKKDLFGHPYTAKTRMLLYSHLVGIVGGLTAEQEEDREYILKKSPRLFEKMVNAFARASFMGTSMLKEPVSLNIAILQKIIDLSQLTIQGHMENDLPLLQLPNIGEITAKFCAFGQKVSVVTPKDLACIPEDQRRQYLHKLNDEEYKETMNVLRNFPHIEMEVDASVLGEKNITTNALVTVNIQFSRISMSELMKSSYTSKITKKDKVLLATKDVDQIEKYDSLIENFKVICENKIESLIRRSEVRPHTVYTRNFPQEKTEEWWVFVEDKNNEKLMFAPRIQSICKLDAIGENDAIELQFLAPEEAGRYTYVVWCRSDSMYGCDASVELELIVHKEDVVAEDSEDVEENDVAATEKIEEISIEEPGSIRKNILRSAEGAKEKSKNRVVKAVEDGDSEKTFESKNVDLDVLEEDLD